MHTKSYNNWLQNAKEYKEELTQIAENQHEIKERFFQNLQFGTAGLRGIMGAGTNRMNVYTVRKAAAGLAEYIISQPNMAERGVAIAFDNRNNSAKFAMVTAEVLAAYDIPAYIFDSLRPTPELSFAVRHLKTIAGVMITASHNPREYNGFKAYWEDGGQLSTHLSEAVLAKIEAIDEFSVQTPSDRQKAQYIKVIDKSVDEAYLAAVLSQKIGKGGSVSITFTPFYGAGNLHIREIFARSGFDNINLVEEQLEPNGDFPTCPYPNPEKVDCWKIALKEAEKAHSDVIMASDPDADRLGVWARDAKGEMRQLSGNEIGVCLTEFVLSNRNLPENPFIISTYVSSRLTKKIATAHNVKYHDVYTGFKNIAEKIAEEKNGNFIMGFEESIGYLIGSHARDKDAPVAALLVANLAQYCKNKGITLWDYLAEIWAKYGRFYEKTFEVIKEGIEGAAEFKAIMENFKSNPPSQIAGIKVAKHINFSAAKNPANMVIFELENGAEICVRPSGTEPKIKFYFSATSEEELQNLIFALTKGL